jgi:hypothetical protein
MSPYTTALETIQEHPFDVSSRGLGKLIVSMADSRSRSSVRDCLREIDPNLAAMAIDMFTQFALQGDDHTLRGVAREVLELYPDLLANERLSAPVPRDERRTGMERRRRTIH